MTLLFQILGYLALIIIGVYLVTRVVALAWFRSMREHYKELEKLLPPRIRTPLNKSGDKTP